MFVDNVYQSGINKERKQMSLVKDYTPEDVDRMLRSSERRVPPGKISTGHTLGRHVNISNADMVSKSYQDFTTRFNRDNTRRLALFTWSTAFATHADAVNAAHFLLNCPEGKTALGNLQGSVGEVEDWWSNKCPELKIRFSSGDFVRRATTNAAAIVVIPLDGGGLHIHTCFPILGSEPQAALAKSL
jgi:hypothetical protein